MPQYFFVQSTSSTRYFSCTASQASPSPGPDTSDTETGTWTTTQSTAEANSFNMGETGAREQIDVKLRFNAAYNSLSNANTIKVAYKITLMGCDTRTGTYVSQGATETRTITAASGTIADNGSYADTISAGGTAEDGTYNFMSKLKFWHIKVVMTNSAFVQMGITNSVKVYGFVAIHDDGFIRKKYKTKTFMHGNGLQVMSGPKSYARFGRNQNLIFGDLNIEGDTEGGGGGYFSKNLTIGTSEKITTHPLYVSGDIAATGNVIAYVSSDERLKSNITPLENSLEKVKRLNPIDFSWNNTNTGWGTESPVDIGLLAQDVEKQFPSIVKEMDDGYKGIRYDRLIPILVDCIKTQDSKIEELKELVEKMTDKLKEE